MHTLGTNTISTDNKCVVRRWRYIIFTEAHCSWTKGHNNLGEIYKTLGKERERDIIYTNGKT